jgi:hypothetical protein
VDLALVRGASVNASHCVVWASVVLSSALT